MKLWYLHPITGHLKGKPNPWDPWYDTLQEIVVRAETEEEARQITVDWQGEEATDWEVSPWLDPTLSGCHELLYEGEPGLIVRNIHEA